MNKTVQLIANLVNGRIIGDPNRSIEGVSSLDKAGPSQISFLSQTKYASFLKDTCAGAVLVQSGCEFEDVSDTISLIEVKNPSVAMDQVIRLFGEEKFAKPSSGISKLADVSSNAEIDSLACIQSFAVISDGCKIGQGSYIGSGVYLGPGVVIGENCNINANVTIMDHSILGNRVTVHSGSVVGSDGFGYATIKGKHQKLAQMGIVVLEDDVEIGSNVSIDRARFDKTVIGKGTKVDNLVQIAHNVEIGENSMILGQVGISGSTKVGNLVVIAGQAGIAGHIKIGDNTVVASKSGVTKSIEPNQVVGGFPAQDHIQNKRLTVSLQKVPSFFKTIHTLEKKINGLEDKIASLEKR